jgi:two-component system cell cycle response regulator DivK
MNAQNDGSSPPATILLVEDNEDNQAIYHAILSHRGYTVLQALDGAEGVRLAREHLPAVIVMDISMPVLDGYEATRMLKADPATVHIPVIALTAHAMAEDRQRAHDAGCDAYLAKPAEPRAVAAEIELILSRAGCA